MSSPAYAFKEWSVMVDALGQGEQIVILRKGGISEGRSGFQLKAEQFWLYPTFFHAQREKSKITAQKYFPPIDALVSPSPQDPISLRYFARVDQALFLSDWEDVQALDPFHFWTEATVRERFDWAKPQGINLLVVRVYRLNEAIALSPTAEMAGCKSWVEMPFGFDAQPSTPVLTDEVFAERKTQLGLAK